jgi:hypothetical protein
MSTFGFALGDLAMTMGHNPQKLGSEAIPTLFFFQIVGEYRG